MNAENSYEMILLLLGIAEFSFEIINVEKQNTTKLSSC